MVIITNRNYTIATPLYKKILYCNEINQADFVSTQTDKTTNISDKGQLRIIVEYVHGLKTEEHFLGFFMFIPTEKHKGWLIKLFRLQKNITLKIN